MPFLLLGLAGATELTKERIRWFFGLGCRGFGFRVEGLGFRM